MELKFHQGCCNTKAYCFNGQWRKQSFNDDQSEMKKIYSCKISLPTSFVLCAFLNDPSH